ncbi:MAG: hypothetical protein IT372_07390 [Polyangiaceae bacterium]|nr:hypothetical protein [Polyangiaceae bacterium]
MLAAATLGAGGPADATTARLLSREELVRRSPIVARVTVGEATSVESEDGASIVTRTELAVTRRLKGAPGDRLVLEQLGGTYRGKTQRVLGDAALSEGEDAVVFLRPGKGGRVHLTALSLAAYHVDREGRAARDLRGMVFVRREGDRLVPAPAPAEAPEPIEHLMTDVVRIAGQE